jgi:hypothetical protein
MNPWTNWKTLVAVLLNIAAVVAPVLALYLRYGLDERISRGNAGVEQLVALGGAMVAGFATALLAGNLLKKVQADYVSTLTAIIKTVSEAQNVRHAKSA